MGTCMRTQQIRLRAHSTTLFQWFYAKGTGAQPGSEQCLMDRVKATTSEISDFGLTSPCKVQGDVQWVRRRGADNATAGILWQENNRHVAMWFWGFWSILLSPVVRGWALLVCFQLSPFNYRSSHLWDRLRVSSWGKEKLHWPRCAAGQRHTGIFHQLPDFSQLIWGQVFQVECQL